ncbi:DEAD-box ATP-dependent RNA helicase 35 [Hibiscus syriacus]|uniref:DEAD-box ATP-dependent RNA helicase 35 n=1 Tax=Hibiscus syriacus TaxID=106335 RepID=A0A6A2XEP4_HIBSY|nr:DEAD-box ATP-dependent RNA helicase 35 [Hibiscus syriacus]
MEAQKILQRKGKASALEDEAEKSNVAKVKPSLLIKATQLKKDQSETYEVVEQFLVPMRENGYPELRPLLCIGGVDMRPQLDVVKKGVHIVVATPGRLKDMLAKKKMKLDNCRSALVKPVTVNVGRAGAANLDVIQEVEYKREYAISSFKAGKKDVLVATDVASKGLDFPDIQHVINYDMPAEIENYVHRIGRTGRCGKTGIATTFINKNQSETTLLDLKHLLQEAKQRIPPVLAELSDPMEDVDAITNASGVKGCAYCGGLGHRIRDCPKLEHQKSMAIANSRRDYFGSGGYRGEI